jgi:hypothetical protein
VLGVDRGQGDQGLLYRAQHAWSVTVSPNAQQQGTQHSCIGGNQQPANAGIHHAIVIEAEARHAGTVVDSLHSASYAIAVPILRDVAPTRTSARSIDRAALSRIDPEIGIDLSHQG